MINPADVTNYNRTTKELEEFLLFCIVVAGKNASVQAVKLDGFLNPMSFVFRDDKKNCTPFKYISYLIGKRCLLRCLKSVKLGKYSVLKKSFTELAGVGLDLRTCTAKDLEQIHGIGPKTSRFFILHSRPKARVAVLDTHILKWMREELGIQTPRATPTGKKYTELEERFLSYCDKHRKDPAQFDLQIWNRYTRYKVPEQFFQR